MNFNSKGEESITYDAIVVGSGISGGWAAKELCEKGVKTLVLERGRMIDHINIFKHIHAKGYTGILGMEHGNSVGGKQGELAVIHAYKTTSTF